LTTEYFVQESLVAAAASHPDAPPKMQIASRTYDIALFEIERRKYGGERNTLKLYRGPEVVA
jgi:hypothetical protein